MNILSEELITNKFPMKLFESPMETLDQIKAELKVFTLNVNYYKEITSNDCFSHFIYVY